MADRGCAACPETAGTRGAHKSLGLCSLGIDDQGVAAHGLLRIQAELDGTAQQKVAVQGLLEQGASELA